MYTVNRENNKLTKIETSAFSELQLKERYDLQEWLTNNPDIFGEELLIIQKEFDGFDGTKERLDILALDKNGNIVVIENKGDDSGRDVVWQNLKYVSYCSTLNKSQILEIYQSYLDKYYKGEKAIDRVQDFFGVEDVNELILNEDQRLFFVALNYRKEVTSTVMWLLNKGIDLKCFKVSMYMLSENLILDIEQIIPVKEAQDYIISMNKKSNDTTVDKQKAREIHSIRKNYWSEILEKLHGSSTELYKNVNPSTDHWLNCGSGISGVVYTLLVGVGFVGVELGISKSKQEENKLIFDNLYKNKLEIENSFGAELDWRRLDEKKMSRIVYLKKDVSIKNKEDWEEMQEFQLKYIMKLEKAFSPFLRK